MRPVSISVVVPLYNKRPHIGETLESILAQSTQPAEIIVVDDGSTDGSADIVARYEKRGVRLIRQKNAGESAARNRGVEASSSAWIAFLDADDLWLPQHIEYLSRAIQAYPEVGLVSSQHEILQNGRRLRPRCAYPNGSICQVDDFYRRFAVGLSLVNSSTACAKRDALLALGGFPEDVHIGPDVITWVRLFEQFGMAHVGEVSAVYRRDAVNRSTAITAVMPGSLLFLSKLLERKSLSCERKKSVGRLFDRIAFFTAAGRKLQGDGGTVAEIRGACWRSKRWLAWSGISSLGMIPLCCLQYAQRWRHKRVDHR